MSAVSAWLIHHRATTGLSVHSDKGLVHRSHFDSPSTASWPTHRPRLPRVRIRSLSLYRAMPRRVGRFASRVSKTGYKSMPSSKPLFSPPLVILCLTAVDSSVRGVATSKENAMVPGRATIVLVRLHLTIAPLPRMAEVTKLQGRGMSVQDPSCSPRTRLTLIQSQSVRPRSPVAYHQVPIHDPETPSGFKQPTLPEHSVAPDRAVEVSFTLEAARAFADRRSGRGDTHYPVTITE